MRIRKCASRLLGSAYFNAQPEAPPQSQLPPPPPPAPAAYGAATATSSEGPCELNQLPWELTSELDDPNPQDDPFENYYMQVGLVLSSVAVNQEDEEMEGEDKIGKEFINKQKVAKKMKQDGKKKVKAKAKKEKAKAKEEEAKANKEEAKAKEEEEASDVEQAKVWHCKKNDGRSWHCPNIVRGPNALCDHHFALSRSYYNPTCEKVAAAAASGAASASSKSAPAKASASSKSVPAKASSKSAPASASSSTKAVSSASALAISKLHKRKKANGGSGMEYFYYAGWGPFRGKQRGDSSSRNHRDATADVKEERSPQEDKASTPEARDDKKGDDDENDLSDIAEITGGDEESDDDYVGSAKASAGNGKGKMAVEKARYPKMARKRVKARSLKSLL